MNLIFLIAALEFGYMPSGNFEMYDYDLFNKIEHAFYVELFTELNVYDFYIGGYIKTFMNLNDTNRLNFSPNNTIYQFNVGYRFSIFELGFRHYCMHPVIPYLPLKNIDKNDMVWEGAYNEVFIRISNGKP